MEGGTARHTALSPAKANRDRNCRFPQKRNSFLDGKVWMDNMKKIWIAPGEPYDLAKQVRQHVFVEEQGFSPELEFDSADPICYHLVLLQEDGTPAATGRLIKEAEKVFSLGRIAVEKSCRGAGLGGTLVREMIRFAGTLGAVQLRLGAQQHAVGFYEKLGFTVCGNAYMDEHVPHLPMVQQAPFAG